MTEKLTGGIVRDWNDYLRLFQNAQNQHAVGEASVGYLWSRTAAAGIAGRFPQARILMVLRSPAERAFSQYLHNMSDGFISQPFRDYVCESLRTGSKGLGVHEPFLDMGMYAGQVQRYFDHFPREQTGIWLYEDTRARPREFMREVLGFLGVDSSFKPDTAQRYNEPRVAHMARTKRFLRRLGVWQMVANAAPKAVRQVVRKAAHRSTSELTMTYQDRAMMVDYYHDDICRLERMLGRDLTAWRTC
jgi:hypothetical protein